MCCSHLWLQTGLPLVQPDPQRNRQRQLSCFSECIIFTNVNFQLFLHVIAVNLLTRFKPIHTGLVSIYRHFLIAFLYLSLIWKIVPNRVKISVTLLKHSNLALNKLIYLYEFSNMKHERVVQGLFLLCRFYLKQTLDYAWTQYSVCH